MNAPAGFDETDARRFGAVVDKVTGAARYTFDIVRPGMLHAKLVRSPHAHARLLGIDVDAALAIAGVACVVTGADLAGLVDPLYGVGLRDQPVIATDRVRYVGDLVAAVVAIDEATAFRAAAAIVVHYALLPALMTPDEALAPEAPRLFEAPPGGSAVPVGQGCSGAVEPEKNVLYEYKFGYGDVAALLARSAHVFTDSFDVSRINHYHLEPYVNVAEWTGNRLDLWSCNQDPFVIRADIARIFGIRLHDVRVHTELVGGGFGGKSYCKMEPLVALLARKARAPVRLALSMDEGLLTLVKHPGRLRLTTGVDADGRLTARRADIRLDGGAYVDASLLVAIKTGFRIGGPYRWGGIDSTARIVRTTTVPSGSFRGFGGTQASFASERQIDMIARRLRRDPVAFRLQNLLRVGEPMAPNDRGMDCDFSAGLEEVTTRLDAAPASSASGRRGRGLAIGLKDAGGTGNHAQAIVRVSQGGDVLVCAAVVDVGQGVAPTLCRIATDVLGLPLGAATYASIDTEASPVDNGTHVSAGTMVSGRAIEAAADDARRQILAFAAERLDCDVADLVLDGWAVRRGNMRHPLEPMVRAYYGGVGWEFTGRGIFKQPYDAATPMGAKNMSWMPCWSGAEVTVDVETGLVTVDKLVVGSEVGRAISRGACHGQIEGAAIQAFGQAMFESLRYAGEAPTNATPLAYRVARLRDVPRHFESFVLEQGLGIGPGGAKGVGEAGMLGIAAAIANAIADATGGELTAMPFTPERVLTAIDKERDE